MLVILIDLKRGVTMLLGFKLCLGLPSKYDFCCLRRIQMELKPLLCRVTSITLTVLYAIHSILLSNYTTGLNRFR